MAVFVLVHGSWHGGWCWKKVTPLFRQTGHEVYTPTFTGMGDRSHLHARAVNLETHIRDIVQLLEYEDLYDTILVGHSYAGMVISGTAEVVPHRIARLVYLDAFIPEDGEHTYELMSDNGEYQSNRARTEGDGWFIPSLTPAELGVTDPADTAWMNARLTPISAATFEQAIRLRNPNARRIPRSFIHTSDYFDPMAARAKTAGWDFHELKVGHDAMITAPP
jgi:pimeloyl-ACP methyl ester carboxylesterase